MIWIKWLAFAFVLVSFPAVLLLFNPQDVWIRDIGAISALALFMVGALFVTLVVFSGPIILIVWVLREIWRINARFRRQSGANLNVKSISPFQCSLSTWPKAKRAASNWLCPLSSEGKSK
jgi:hypothetical protein